MEIKIFGNNKDTKILLDKVNNSLEELGLSDFIKTQITNDETLKKELDISKEPALIIIEEAIEFKDTIFEGIIPNDNEIKSMLISIIGGSEPKDGCSPSNCGNGCSC